MKMLFMTITATLAITLGGWVSPAAADPDKDESGKGRWRDGYERSYDSPGRGYGYGYERPRRERRAFKEEYDDGRCKYERKLEKSGEYKEEVKCRGGRPGRASYGYRY
jgi:hypothetical protein